MLIIIQRSICLALFLSCLNNISAKEKTHFSDSVGIDLTIINGSDLPVNISTPVNGCFMIGQWLKTKTDRDGVIQLRFALDTSGFCQIWLNYLPWVGRTNFIQLFVEPGENYTISLEKGNEFESMQFKGDNVIENQFLNSFTRYTIDHWGNSEYLKSIMSNSSEKSLLEKITNMKDKDIADLNKLKRNKYCSERFLTLVEEDIRYYFANMYFIAWNVKKNNSKSEGNSEESQVWNKDLETLIKNTPIDNENALGSYWYNEYKFIIWPYYFEEELNELRKTSKDSIDSKVYDIVYSNFSGKVKEQHLAFIIRSNALKNKFSKSFQNQFLKFQNDFPTSTFLVLLKQEFQGTSLWEENKQKENLVLHTNINSLRELTSRYKNQVLFIDVWASWCGPCKEEFKSENKQIDSLINSQNIQKIFISIDDTSKIDICKQIISYYNLEGDHYMATSELLKSLEIELNNSNKLSIPRYFIVDKQGKVIVKDAYRPSFGMKLFEQLKKAST